MPFHLFTGMFRTGFTSEKGNTGITGRYLPVFKTLLKSKKHYATSHVVSYFLAGGVSISKTKPEPNRFNASLAPHAGSIQTAFSYARTASSLLDSYLSSHNTLQASKTPPHSPHTTSPIPPNPQTLSQLAPPYNNSLS
ncbi:hypothetical protein Hanom_Chr06g00568971 [Helianthus anomalus]